MPEEYLLIAGISIIIILALCIVLFYLRRQHINNEKILSEQINVLQNSIDKNSEFFSNMAHELKTPLSIILGAVQLLELNRQLRKDDKLNEAEDRLERNIKVIKCNCRRMLRLTHNLLDLTKAEAGYQLLKPTNCNLDLLLEEIILSVKPYAEEKQLNLYYNPSPKEITIAIDIEKMERIMLNLLSNAIKFTKRGGVVSVSSYPERGRAFISVLDSGIGIPAEKQKDVLYRFKQAGHSSHIENNGSGIGLSLVKTLVELHKGNINIRSGDGKGTEFIIDLPIRVTDHNTEEFTESELSSEIAEAAKLEFSSLPNMMA